MGSADREMRREEAGADDAGGGEGACGQGMRRNRRGGIRSLKAGNEGRGSREMAV